MPSQPSIPYGRFGGSAATNPNTNADTIDNGMTLGSPVEHGRGASREARGGVDDDGREDTGGMERDQEIGAQVEREVDEGEGMEGGGRGEEGSLYKGDARLTELEASVLDEWVRLRRNLDVVRFPRSIAFLLPLCLAMPCHPSLSPPLPTPSPFYQASTPTSTLEKNPSRTPKLHCPGRIRLTAGYSYPPT